MNYKRDRKLGKQKNLSYGEHKHQKMDLCWKKGEEKLPLLVNIHGGAFVKGDKKYRRSICEDFAGRGWFVANLNYRLAPKNPLPAALQDVFECLKVLSAPEFVEKHNLDLNRVVLTGDSSGAYTATMVACALTNEKVRIGWELPKVDIKPTALISFCAPFDFQKAIEGKLPFGLTRSIGSSVTGIKLSKDCREVSTFKYFEYICPCNFVTKEWPPTFIVYSEKDPLCAGQSELLIEKLQQEGIYVEESHSVKTADTHCYHLFPFLKASRKTMKCVHAFLEAVRLGENLSAEKPAEAGAENKKSAQKKSAKIEEKEEVAEIVAVNEVADEIASADIKEELTEEQESAVAEISQE